MSVVIKYCSNCADNNLTHVFQDEAYGRFFRVMNTNEKGGSKCTVCNSGAGSTGTKKGK